MAGAFSPALRFCRRRYGPAQMPCLIVDGASEGDDQKSFSRNRLAGAGAYVRKCYIQGVSKNRRQRQSSRPSRYANLGGEIPVKHRSNHMGHLVTKNNSQFIMVPVFREDGVIDGDAIKGRLDELLAEVVSEEQTTTTTLLVDLSQALVALPNKKNMTEDDLARLIWNRKVKAGTVNTDDPDQEKIQYERHKEVLGNLLRSRPGQFHVGQGSGVLIRYVDGDDSGNFDAQGEPIPRQRFSDEDWTKIRAAAEVSAQKKAEKAAAKAAKSGASA
jgi:hypothetical protein